MIGFDGPLLPAEVASLLSRGLAGVALFGRNIVDRAQVADLCRAVRDAARGLPPPLVAVDEEGGRVQRLKRICPVVPPMREVGAAGPGAAAAEGAAIGRELAALGFNLDFAPVLDVDTNAANPVIGDRAFSGDADAVAACAVAFARALESEGVRACGKHFPGHGDAAADSHLDLPVIAAGADTLAVRELRPFEAAVRAGIGIVMTAHCVYPAIDAALPATLSRAHVTGLLRGRLGFGGVVVTDDLGMKAIEGRWGPDEVLGLGLDAGVDLFLHCGPRGEGIALGERLRRLVADGAVARERVVASAGRVMALRAG
jgi:beta-N-acetylhexosaminidase